LSTLPQNNVVRNLAFDSDGLRLAIGGSDELITLWNFALVRPELDSIDLDWGARLPPALLSTKLITELQLAPTVKMVSGPRGQQAEPDGLQNQLAVLYHQGRFGELLPLAEQATRADPNDRALYTVLAAAHYNLGNYRQAAEASQRHLDLCPDCPGALHLLASCRLALGSHEEAIQLLNQVLRINPNLAEPCNGLAWIYATGPVKLRAPDKALALAHKALQLAPDRQAYHHTLGVVYYRLAKYKESLAALEHGIEPDKGGATAFDLFFLAMCHHRLGDADKARECYDRALKWVQERQAKLRPQESEELTAFRAEAEAELAKVSRP
jgi:tetratricopeptide (TPR) repeat protein